jgi:hypothetical protein
VGADLARVLGVELIGSDDRPIFNPRLPFGMAHRRVKFFFHMGQTDQDISASMVNMNKQVTITSFHMDETGNYQQ